MNELTKILSNYGLGHPDVKEKDHIHKTLIKIFTEKEQKENQPDSYLKQEIYRRVLLEGSGVQVSDPDKFKRLLFQGELTTTLEDWELQLICLEITHFERHCQIQFGYRYWDLDEVLEERMRTHSAEMKKRDVKFSLSYTFDRETAIREKSDEIMEKMDAWIEKLNETLFVQRMGRELDDELWEMYQQARVKA